MQPPRCMENAGQCKKMIENVQTSHIFSQRDFPSVRPILLFFFSMAYASPPQGRCLVLRGVVLRANFLFVGFLANDSPGPKAKHSSCSCCCCCCCRCCCCCCCSSEWPVARILLQLCAADLTALLWLRSARHVPKSCRKCQVSLKVAIDEIIIMLSARQPFLSLHHRPVAALFEPSPSNAS